MGLVKDWKNFYKWYSTWIVLIASVLIEVWATIPLEYRQQVADLVGGYEGLVLFVCFMIVRLKDQGSKE